MSGSVEALLKTWACTAKHAVPIVLKSKLKQLGRSEVNQHIRTWTDESLRIADIKVEVEGLEHIEATKNYVVLSNHQSSYDIFAMFATFPGTLRMAAKEELYRIPIFGDALHAAEFIKVERERGERARYAVEVAKKRIASGISVWMAPEGTRSIDGSLLPFKKGGFVLAINTQTPILPATIIDTRKVLPSDAWLPRTGRTIKVVFHAPIPTVDLTYEDRSNLLEQTRRAIESAL